ncbi:hypothetical protein Tco_0376274, partial [Tanacetum coccineum]
DDKGKGKVHEAKKAKQADHDQEVVQLSSDEDDSSDEGFFGDEDVVLFNDSHSLIPRKGCLRRNPQDP